MKELSEILERRWVRLVLALGSSAVLGAMLVATIYWTLFDLQWLAFLGGMLFAAVMAMASRVSKAELTIFRQNEALQRVREQLGQESARLQNATESARIASDSARIAEARLRLLADALPTLVLYVDREERCRYHNRAVENKTGRAAQEISGKPLHDVTGNAYVYIAPRIPETLRGKPAEYEFSWGGTALPENYVARHVPYPPGDSKPRGFYLILAASGSQTTSTTIRRAPRASEYAAEVEVSTGESGETLYLRSIAGELMGWDDPREKLERALKEDQFLLFAQKMLALRTGLPDPLCSEVLLRLREEEDNLLPPGGFIPIAERYGMMEELDRWVVQNLIAWCVRLQRDGRPVPLYCVNLSEDAIRAADFAGFVRNQVQQQGFNARSLCFEIGEPDVMAQHGRVQRLINTLKPLGCRFTVDAFGSVKVSFTHLKGLAVDFVKIDGVIIQNILRDAAELAKTRAIRTACAKVGLRTIAEFVESRETLEKLREIGIDYVQGFGVARPGPIEKQ